MNVLITGATSFIGLKLVEKQLYNGNVVVAVIRKMTKSFEPYIKNPNVHILFLDMCDYGDLRDVLHHKIDVVYHVAWNGTRNPERYDEILQKENYMDSCTLIDACIKLGVKSIIGLGSQAEYGLVNEEIYEDTVCNPNTAYGIYKEQTCNYLVKECINHHVLGIWTRLFSIFGPEDNPSTLIHTLLSDMKEHKNIDVTLCEQQWNYLYIDDLVHYLYLFSITPCMSGIYNLASNETKPLKEFVFDIQYELKSKSKISFGSKPYGKEGIVNLLPNVKKVHYALHYREHKTFRERVHDMIVSDCKVI